MYLCQLLGPSDEMADSGNFAQAKTNCERGGAAETSYKGINCWTSYKIALRPPTLVGPPFCLPSSSCFMRRCSYQQLKVFHDRSISNVLPCRVPDHVTMVRGDGKLFGVYLAGHYRGCPGNHLLFVSYTHAKEAWEPTIMEWPRTVGVLYSSNANLVAKSPLIGPYWPSCC